MTLSKISSGAVHLFCVLSSVVCDMPNRLARRFAEKKAAGKYLIPLYVVPVGDVDGQSRQDMLDRRVSQMQEDIGLVNYRVEWRGKR